MLERIQYWTTLSGTQIARLDRQRTVLIWPLGQNHPHGPHLPQGTATYISRYIAREAADLLTLTARELNVVILPTLAYGLAPEDDPAPAADLMLSLQPATMQRIVTDLGQKLLASAGFRALFGLHYCTTGQPSPALQEAFVALKGRARDAVVDLIQGPVDGPDAPAAPDLTTLARRRITPREQAALTRPEHAGMRTTAMLLAIDPNLVEPGYLQLKEHQPTEGISDDDPGYYGGAPALADAALGRALLSEQAYRCAALMRAALSDLLEARAD
ncbi:MAG: creatininase family protein [Anaerolineae bacterium]